MCRRLARCAVVLAWCFAVLLLPDIAAYAADEPTPTATPTATATEAPTTDPTGTPTATTEAEPTEPAVTETATTCGTVEQPCMVQLVDEQWSPLDEGRAVTVAGLAVLVLCSLAALVGSWGRRG